MAVTKVTHAIRLAVVAVAAALYANNDAVDGYVKHVWLAVRGNPWFANHFFEAWFPLVWFPVCCSVWLTLDFLYENVPTIRRWLHPYKLAPHDARSAPSTNLGADFYVGVLLYVVPPAVLELRKAPRHLRMPEDVPGLWGLLGSVAVNMFIFDTFFFAIHLAFHKNKFLWRNVHRVHHQDTVLRATDANWVHVVERLSLVLSAALALTITGAHDFVRTLYTMYAIWELVSNHSGYDLPWMPANVVPFGMLSGSERHEQHHRFAIVYFGEYFTLWDNVYMWFQGVPTASRQPHPRLLKGLSAQLPASHRAAAQQ